MPVGRLREKVLYGITRKRKKPNRFTVYRWVVGVVFTVAVALLPLTDTLRFDFWGGNHMYLGERLGLVEVAKAFAFPFLAVNIVIIVASRYIGRYLCGFVCPYGAMARFAEWFRFHSKHPSERVLGTLLLLGASALLAAITFSFWIDWRVFVEGSTLAMAVSGTILLGMTLGLFLFVRVLGLRFCREWCPSGVYFAILGHNTVNGIDFDHPENCTECGACEKVCPMDLKPKDMSGGAFREGMGFYSERLSNFSLCIRCGDCIVACEGVTKTDHGETPLRLGWLPEGHRESRELPKEEREAALAALAEEHRAANARREAV